MNTFNSLREILFQRVVLLLGNLSIGINYTCEQTGVTLALFFLYWTCSKWISSIKPCIFGKMSAYNMTKLKDASLYNGL